MSEVQDKVVEIVCNQLTVNKEDVTPDSSFVEDLGADSLDTVESVSYTHLTLPTTPYV